MDKNTVNTANTNTISDADRYIRGISRIIKNNETSSDTCIRNKICEYLARDKGALTWLLTIRYMDDFTFNEYYIEPLDLADKKRLYNISPEDIIEKIIKIRINALKRVALEINLKDLVNELEEVAWCVDWCAELIGSDWCVDEI